MLKNRRLIILMMMLLSFGFLMIGCGQKQAEQATQEQPKQTQQEAKKYVIGIPMPNMTHPLRRGMAVKIDEYVKQHPNITTIVTDGQKDSMKQNADVEDLIAKKVDAILLCPNQTEALKGGQEAILKASIPLIGYDRSLPLDQYDAFVGASNYKMGQEIGEYVVEKMGTKGLAISLEGTPGSSAAIDRKAGFEDVLKKYPDIKIESYVTDFTRQKAVLVMEDVLARHPKIDVVYGNNDESALGALQVLEEEGRLKDTMLVGSDGQKEALEAIIAGKMAATVSYPLFFPEVLDLTLQILNGEKVEKNVELDVPLVTKDNVDQYYDPNSVF